MPKLDGGTIVVELDYEILEDNGEYMVEISHPAMDGSIYLNRKTEEGCANLMEQLTYEDPNASETPIRVSQPSTQAKPAAPVSAERQPVYKPGVDLETIFEGATNFICALTDLGHALKRNKDVTGK